MERSGFFNALRVDGDYDRKYNADDYCDNLAAVISSGVLRSINDDLKVTANGMLPTVAKGRAWINGHYYNNDTEINLSAVVPPVGGARKDRIVLRLDNRLEARNIRVLYIQGEASNTPVPPALARTEQVYELCLAEIYVVANATNITITDTRDDDALCGWVYSVAGDNHYIKSLDNAFYEWFAEARNNLASVTLFKRYTDIITLDEETDTVAFNIPQYSADVCFLEVYVNGILEKRFSAVGDAVVFNAPLIAGTIVTVNAFKSIDGTGIESVADEITDLQDRVDALDIETVFQYRCSGVNDNISISQICEAFSNGGYTAAQCTAKAVEFLEALGGNEYLADLSPNEQLTINVVGACGIQNAYAGAGTENEPYVYFSCSTSNSARRIVLDFSRCGYIAINCANNTHNRIFAGAGVNIHDATILAYGGAQACNITMFSGNDINIADCCMGISTSGNALISKQGDFTNCKANITGGSATGFEPASANLIRLNGGEYLAYCRSSASTPSAVIRTGAADLDAVVIATAVNFPKRTRPNYAQGLLAVANGGAVVFNTCMSVLTTQGAGVTLNNHISKNK